MGKEKAIYLLIFLPISFLAWTVRADSSNVTATTETATASTQANATETVSEAANSNSTFTSSSTTSEVNTSHAATTEQPLTTSNDSTTTSNTSKNATTLENGTSAYATNVTSTTPTNITTPNNTEVVTTTQPSTTRTTLATPSVTTITDANEASQNTTVYGTTTRTKSIVERVKSNWVKAVTETNFSSTALNNTRIRDITPSEVIEIMIEYYKGKNESELENFLKSERVDEVAKQVLENNPSIVEIYIKDDFSASQNFSLFGLVAALHWMNDEVLEDRPNFLELMTSYDRKVSQGSGNDTNQNSTSKEATAKSFILFILSNASAKDLFNAICGAAVDDLSGSVCSTAMPPTETSKPLPSGAEKFEETWKELISSQNFDFLSESQTDELQAITPSNMTTGLIQYVVNLRDTKIQELVNANITRYVTGLLRNGGISAVNILGEDAIRAFGGNKDKEDVYYVYLSFINNVYSQSGRFEAILRKYVNGSLPSAARTVPSCDTSTITARGLCCYTIATEAQDQEALRNSVCDELDGGTDCINSFSIKNDEEAPTSLPVSEGLSTGVIIGIVLGAVIGFALLVLIIFLIWKQCNKKKSKINPQDRESHCDDMEMDGRRTSETRPRELSQANGQPSSRNGISTP